MNQILVTKKLYVTPELKKKKKVYKFNFIISVFLICILVSFYIYAEYDRNKSEETSQEILASLNETIQENKKDTTVAKNNVLVIVLDEEEQGDANYYQNLAVKQEQPKYTTGGYTYSTIGTVNIPKINVTYPILNGETPNLTTEQQELQTEALLKIAPTKFWGTDPNEVGNFCIVGHNYRNTRFFSKVPTLVNGDVIEITDLDGKTLNYAVYDKYTVDPNDLSCTSQLTAGRKEITLITCTDDSKLRVVVKAKEMK